MFPADFDIENRIGYRLESGKFVVTNQVYAKSLIDNDLGLDPDVKNCDCRWGACNEDPYWECKVGPNCKDTDDGCGWFNQQDCTNKCDWK